MAKELGLKVWTFKKRFGKIEQVFFDDGKTFGTASATFGGVRYGTCHKACRSCGTGFSFGEDSTGANKDRILASLSFAPNWAWNQVARDGIVKQTFIQYMYKNILEYYEL